MVQAEPQRWVVVDAGKDWLSVQDDLREKIMEFIR
jgi:hypothetical protein